MSEIVEWAVAPPLPGRVVFDQVWCDLAFLHWPVDPDEVARFMPPRVRPDLFDGQAHVGLVPFRMRRAGFGQGHPMPWLGGFLEWNVRLYSVDEDGRHGVVFRTLDANRLGVVAAARWGMGVPYVFSRMRADPYPVERPAAGRTVELPTVPVGSERHWTLRRRFPGPPATASLTLRVGAPTEPTPLEVFLTSRWGMHSALGGRPLWVPNEHRSWPLHEATVTDLDETLVAAAGLTPTGPMLRALWTPGVHARFAGPRSVR